MPLYTWRNNKTGREVEIIRHFSEYETPPTREEANDWSDEEYSEADWERLIALSRWVRGNWGGGKGHW
jgi:hypothetical protein